jgi:ribosomal-protein-serine acetyltransferase
VDPRIPMSEGSIAVRPFQPEDAEETYRVIQESAPELSLWLPNLSASLTREDIARWIASGEALTASGQVYNFAIVDAKAGVLLGGCGLTNINQTHRFANLYYWVRTSATGGGAASTAARLLAGFGLTRLNLIRIEIVVAVGNTASLRAAEKAGAKREGILRNRLMHTTGPTDAVMFSLIPGDL